MLSITNKIIVTNTWSMQKNSSNKYFTKMIVKNFLLKLDKKM